ncbi:MAG: signal peptidase I [Actinomycetota bacterium]
MSARRGRHRTGRVALARSREAEPATALDIEVPGAAAEPVTGEPLSERAMRELNPEVLRKEDVGPSSVEEASAENGRARSGRYRTGRRALMLGCWSILGFAGVIVLSVTLPNAFGLRDLTVLSGSMEPTISTGDVIVERQISPLDARLGDIVSFKDPEDASILITHRVQSMVVREGVVSFVTKGDANTGVERWKVSADGTIGKVEYHLPHLGYVLSFIRQPLGRIVLVVVPALLIGTYELIRIWRPEPGSDAPSDPKTDETGDRTSEEGESDEATA